MDFIKALLESMRSSEVDFNPVELLGYRGAYYLALGLLIFIIVICVWSIVYTIWKERREQ